MKTQEQMRAMCSIKYILQNSQLIFFSPKTKKIVENFFKILKLIRGFFLLSKMCSLSCLDPSIL